MASLAIALPCLPGGGDKLRALAAECAGERAEEFDDFHRRAGLTREHWYLQQAPQGELCIVVLEGDPVAALQTLAEASEPFDAWFADRVKEVHGVDFREPLPGPPPEPVFDR